MDKEIEGVLIRTCVTKTRCQIYNVLEGTDMEKNRNRKMKENDTRRFESRKILCSNGKVYSVKWWRIFGT